MSPANRFHLFVATLTVGFMYWLLGHLSAWFPSTDALGSWQKAAIAYISSAGFYQLSATGLRYVLDHSKLARQWTLGAAYIEGTWIGCYKTPGNENRLTVEHFEQTLDGIAIKGYAFTEGSDRPVVDWTSRAAAVDGSLGVLTYSYTCNQATDKTSFEGIADFKFERAQTRKPPQYLNGYSADLIDGIRAGNRESLLSREQVDLPTAWKRAKQQKLC